MMLDEGCTVCVELVEFGKLGIYGYIIDQCIECLVPVGEYDRARYEMGQLVRGNVMSAKDGYLCVSIRSDQYFSGQETSYLKKRLEG